jgi:hypothetical protein
MKKYFLSGLLMGGLVCGFAYAASVTNQKINQDQDQLKADYQNKVNQDLRRLDRKIKNLQHKTDAQMNADLKATTKKLQMKKAEADQKMEALEKSTGDAWKDLKQGMDDALTDLKASVDAASSQFKTSPTPVSR